jgi:hypothetical protein
VFCIAEEVALECQARVPILEDVQGLLISANGMQRWLCNETLCNKVLSDTQRQAVGQPTEQSTVIPVEQGSQAVRTSWLTTPTLAKIEKVFYRGIVWCIKVPSAAFVVKRSGKVFITGNSGFPKSLTLKEGKRKGWGTALKPAVEFWILAKK